MKKRTQQEIIYFLYKKLITHAFKIIKEKLIQSCFKTFMERIEFKFVLFLFYPTPLYVTGRRKHVRPDKVYISLISATRKMDLVMSVRPSVCYVQTTFLGHHKSYRHKILHRHAIYVRTERYLTVF